MPRGGKREGAGRKLQLNEMERLRVVAHYKRLWREAEQEKLEKEITEATKHVKAEMRSAIRETGVARIDHDDLLDALRLDQHVSDDENPSPNIHVSIKRLWGERSRIIEEVAKAHGIERRMVKRCVDEFRTIEKDTAP